MAHPRVHILRLLIGPTACVRGEIVDAITLAQSTVPQHLKIHKESGLIQADVDGPRVCYCIDRDKFKALKKLIADLKSGGDQFCFPIINPMARWKGWLRESSND